jgi:hypothetical protein
MNLSSESEAPGNQIKHLSRQQIGRILHARLNYHEKCYSTFAKQSIASGFWFVLKCVHKDGEGGTLVSRIMKGDPGSKPNDGGNLKNFNINRSECVKDILDSVSKYFRILTRAQPASGKTSLGQMLEVFARAIRD